MKRIGREPLVVITNPHSTSASRTQREVHDVLDYVRVRYIPVETRFPQANDNIRDIEDRLPDWARVISAAGDGTAEQVANAALDKPGIKIGVLPYGNYNDTAHAHIDKIQGVLDLIYAEHTVDRHPVSLDVDGVHETHAFSYMTLGLLARIAAGFDDKRSRERMQSADRLERVMRRYGQAALDYWRNRNYTLPDFSVDGRKVEHSTTDITIANNPHVAGLLHLPDTYFDKPYFGVRTDLTITRPRDILGFGIPALRGRDVLDRATQMRIVFEAVAQSVPIQVGGEYKALEDVHELFFYKDTSKKVTYLHPLADGE